MSVSAYFAVLTTGAAAIGFWVVARYGSRVEPGGFAAALLLAGACLLLGLMPTLSGVAMRHIGVRWALLLVVLPLLVAVFCVAGSLVRLALGGARGES